MKLTNSLSVILLTTLTQSSVFASASPTPSEKSEIEARDVPEIFCGTCSTDNKNCVTGTSIHLCYGQAGCGGASECPGGCFWQPGDPDYGQWAQC